MDSLFLLAIVLLLGLFVGAVLGFVAFFRVQRISSHLDRLERELHELRGLRASAPQEGVKREAAEAEASPVERPPVTTRAEAIAELQRQQPKRQKQTEAPPAAAPAEAVVRRSDSAASGSSLAANLKDNWMIWLGGICVGLAGIFLVRYSIETGLLGPAQRISAALATGISLHVLAQWLRRRASEPHPAFAALAGGASITLYAAMLAALHLYQLLNPGLVFVVLTLVSLFTMLLALRDGPVLAIIGILGAYVVPILVDTGSDSMLSALLYSLIISGAALLLIRYVYRSWLWYGTLAGGIGWWAISLSQGSADGFRGIYLAVLAYGFIALPSFDWRLDQSEDASEQAVRDQTASLGWRLQPLQIGLFLITCAQAVSIALSSFTSTALLNWGLLPALLILAAARRTSIGWLPWIVLVSQWFAWIWCGLDFTGDPIRWQGLSLALQNQFLLFAAGMVTIYSGLSWFAGHRCGYRHLRFSMVCLAPVLWLALAYLLVTDLSVSWEWSIGSLVLGIAFIVRANIRLLKEHTDQGPLWLILAGHFAIALAAVMFFRQASLTLALSVLVISLVSLLNRFGVDGLQWLVRGILAVVVIRLTLNPWLLTYPKDIHWSLWTYGGAALCCGLAAWLCRANAALKKWLEAATLHLLVLFLAAETRYLLYDGNIFIRDYTLTEAAINSVLWSMLGLAYHYRATVSQLLSGYYRFCSRLLMAMAMANHAVVLTALNPLWSGETISTTPIWNLLLGAYGTPVLISLICLRFYDHSYRTLSAAVAGISLFSFVSMEIRHLWQPGLTLKLSTSDGELYTYSLVWLIMAIAALLLAAHTRLRKLYQAGMGVLLLVIAKIFLVDMAGLEGLLRVASFMGLGLSLLGLAYLYQKIMKSSALRANGTNRGPVEEKPSP